MKKLAHFCGIMLAATSFMFQSCDDSDGYSIGDIAVDWATVEAKDSHTYSLTGDTWGTLSPAASAFPWSPEDGERVVIVFNPLYDDFQGYDCAIKIEGIRSILTKDVEELTEENDAELGNDPIYIEKRNMWIGGGYMNIVFRQNLPAQEKHRISLVHTTPLALDSEGYLTLELRYNTYDDMTGLYGNGAVSFNLNSIEALPGMKGVKIKLNSAVNGEVTVPFELMDEPTPNEVKQMDFSKMEIE